MIFDIEIVMFQISMQLQTWYYGEGRIKLWWYCWLH